MASGQATAGFRPQDSSKQPPASGQPSSQHTLASKRNSKLVPKSQTKPSGNTMPTHPLSVADVDELDGRLKRSIVAFTTHIREEIMPSFRQVVDFSDERLRTSCTKTEKEKHAACVAHRPNTATKHTKLLAAAINKMASSKVACYVGAEIT